MRKRRNRDDNLALRKHLTSSLWITRRSNKLPVDELDHGHRCDRHIGEAFRVRCTDCDREAERATAERTVAGRVRYQAGSHCPRHDGYMQPCDACARDLLRGDAE
jgi:hypothetical protein